MIQFFLDFVRGRKHRRRNLPKRNCYHWNRYTIYTLGGKIANQVNVTHCKHEHLTGSRGIRIRTIKSGIVAPESSENGDLERERSTVRVPRGTPSQKNEDFFLESRGSDLNTIIEDESQMRLYLESSDDEDVHIPSWWILTTPPILRVSPMNYEMNMIKWRWMRWMQNTDCNVQYFSDVDIQ